MAKTFKQIQADLRKLQERCEDLQSPAKRRVLKILKEREAKKKREQRELVETLRKRREDERRSKQKFVLLAPGVLRKWERDKKPKRLKGLKDVITKSIEKGEG